MTKIKTIEISNLKAIDFQKIDLNGCSVLVTGANRKGKSTLLQGMIDRIRGLRPSRAVRTDQKEGRGLIELDNGEKFKWEFDTEGKDKLTYITKDGYASRVTKEISKKYFPEPFDIDEFMLSQPAQQLKMLAALVGLDFAEIDAEYLEAYNARTVKNKAELEAKVKYEDIDNVPENVAFVDSKKLVEEKKKLQAEQTEKYNENKLANEKMRETFDLEKDAVRKEVKEFNELQDQRAADVKKASEALHTLNQLGYEGREVSVFIGTMPAAVAHKVEKAEIEQLEEPAYIIPELPEMPEIDKLDNSINDLNAINEKAKAYKDYQDIKKEYDVARMEAQAADDKVQSILARKKEMIAAVKFPAGIEYTEDGVLVDGFLLSDQNVSRSQKYIAAIRMGALRLGEVMALHFDASTLDRAHLMEIEAWAQSEDLQLLIERPAFEGGEIKYELIES